MVAPARVRVKDKRGAIALVVAVNRPAQVRLALAERVVGTDDPTRGSVRQPYRHCLLTIASWIASTAEFQTL
ncbi:protein of unknown function [Candidatus Filomicrobium marinum]|uniref:Uncharacterized protein n=1 Tax=Candidatus Filomicrobium marinum TaxID=1608628 RepID=A0A0D6J9I0_9HYPH|nr:protein of unknown function [Candidatus Filomicrobium marinum]CPR14795.1 protein of unknown function [Candidatus Filomicrobium marinum]